MIAHSVVFPVFSPRFPTEICHNSNHSRPQSTALVVGSTSLSIRFTILMTPSAGADVPENANINNYQAKYDLSGRLEWTAGYWMLATGS